MKPFSVTIPTGETERWASSKDAPGYVEAIVLLVYAPDSQTADSIARVWIMRRNLPIPLAIYVSEITDGDKKTVKEVKREILTADRCCIPQVDGDFRFHAQTCKHASPTGLPVYIDNRGGKR